MKAAPARLPFHHDSKRPLLLPDTLVTSPPRGIVPSCWTWSAGSSRPTSRHCHILAECRTCCHRGRKTIEGETLVVWPQGGNRYASARNGPVGHVCPRRTNGAGSPQGRGKGHVGPVARPARHRRGTRRAAARRME